MMKQNQNQEQNPDQNQSLQTSNSVVADEFEFTDDVLKGYDRREVDHMATRFCDTMIAEEPDDEKFWNWLKGKIRGEEK